MSNFKIIDRIKKLLALSKSSNQHEAANAAAMATELMLKHEIEFATLNAEVVDDVMCEILEKTKSLVNWKAFLMQGIANGFGCQMFVNARFDQKAGRKLTQYNVVGQTSKIPTIVYMYKFLVNEVDRLAKEGFEKFSRGASARSWKNSFRLGAAMTISKRLVAQRTETHKDVDTAALVVVKKAVRDVDMHLATNYPALGKTARPQHGSRSGYGAGSAAGANVGLGGTNTRISAGSRQLGAGGNS